MTEFTTIRLPVRRATVTTAGDSDRPSPEQTGLRPWLVIMLLVVFGLLVCARMPMIVVDGRLWAEEGNHFFESAWCMAPGSALFVSFGGYLNLVANAASVAARWMHFPFHFCAAGKIACIEFLLPSSLPTQLRTTTVR